MLSAASEPTTSLYESIHSAKTSAMITEWSVRRRQDPEPRPRSPYPLARWVITLADRCLPSALIRFGGKHRLIRSAGRELRHAQRHHNADQGDPCEQRHDER